MKVSACIYLGSRLPQVLKNIKRGSVEGLSPWVLNGYKIASRITHVLPLYRLMFICTVMGNLTYGLGTFSDLCQLLCVFTNWRFKGIILRAKKLSDILGSLPFLVGRWCLIKIFAKDVGICNKRIFLYTQSLGTLIFDVMILSQFIFYRF